ncbi:hypothetical protein [Nannocystis radixulma]|uniref:Uncharacterized protein n=1 Tax=Nannocystis radixulma TaxID=2995305 RepID=A0ABT5AZV4_9BACT|nr:hypothetical protein [Nannocystis radixulma]MDC0667361.1 hypothetical protein [Nannocystis radixulma]
MGNPAQDITTEDLGFVCDEPKCELASGPLGLTAAEIQARVLALQTKPPPPANEDPDEDETEEEGGDEDEDEGEPEDLESGDDPADPTAIDPLGDGAPCPLCRAAQPPRQGKLLAIANRGIYARVLAAATGLFGLRYWQLVESDSTTGTNRLLDAQRHALGDATKSKATSTFVIGRKLITAVVLKALPFDGHLLRLGNRDADVFEMIVIPAAKGKKERKKKGWARGDAKYGLDHSPPGPTARANPVYVRELQEDLIWLGYFSPSRGNPCPGKFDVFTLGAVLAFKQDLAELYGVSVSPTRISVAPGSVRAGEFHTAIWSQAAFVSPLRIMLDWCSALLGGKKRKGVQRVAAGLARGVKNNLAKAKTAKSFRSYLATLEQRRATLAALADAWPHVAALENVDKPFTPFAPKSASNSVSQLAAVPPGKQPKHADAKALASDAVWSLDEYNARDDNRSYFFTDLRKALGALHGALDEIADARGRIDELTPPAEVAAEWDPVKSATETTLATLNKLLGLVRFWILDSPRQVEAWLAHIAELGTVDQPTAVYLKALREGGKIGPNRRPAYQLQAMTLKDDFGSADTGGKFLRDECTGRPANKSGGKSTTMPEIVALQFFGNESGLTFTHTLAPYNTRAEDKDTRIIKMGADVNAHRRGSFDPVFHVGGDWFVSRGWGVGQATDVNIKLDGVQLRRGLPVLPPGAEAVQHPKPYVDREVSVADAMDRKVLVRYDRSDRRDCTFRNIPDGYYYDCHTCLKRFFDENLRGEGRHGWGSVFVPVGDGIIGDPRKAKRFFVDFERYTPFARGKDGVEDPEAPKRYQRFFNLEPPPVDPNVAAVLRKMDGSTAIRTAAEAVAKAAGVDVDSLVAGVEAHVKARSQLPCSWFQVRFGYTGSGEQAFGSLFDLLDVAGDLDTKNQALIKHIQEASALRRS